MDGLFLVFGFDEGVVFEAEVAAEATNKESKQQKCINFIMWQIKKKNQ